MKVVVIVANGLHLGYVGCYGNDWVGTPALDCLAAEGVVFDQHYADQPAAAGARRAWRTGRYDFPDLAATAAAPTDGPLDLIRMLRQQGVVTCLIHEGRSGVPEFAADWDRVLTVPASEDADVPAIRDAVRSGLKRLKKAEHWLLWVELSMLLPPWRVPETYFAAPDQETDETDELDEGEDEEQDEDGDDEVDDGEDADPEGDQENDDEGGTDAVEEEEPLLPLTDPVADFLPDDAGVTQTRLQETYASAVRYLDDSVQIILEEVKRLLDDESLILLTSDRGLALGEHGIVLDHRPWLHDELIHLPLIVRLPGGAEGGRRINALTQPIDLLPTLLDAFAIKTPVADVAVSPAVHGHSLWPLLHGSEQPVREHAYVGLRIGQAIELALRTSDWAFLLPLKTIDGDPPRNPRLYVKPEDRWEVNDVIQHHPDVAEQLEATLRDFVKRK